MNSRLCVTGRSRGPIDVEDFAISGGILKKFAANGTFPQRHTNT
jgi:hypothetical protein